MPLDRTRRLKNQPVEMEKAEDIGLIFDALAQIPSRGFFTKDQAERDVAEEVGYQLIVHPDWIRAHVPELVRCGVTTGMTFDWLCELLDGAPEMLVEELLLRHRTDAGEHALWLLLATRAPAAMEAVADAARREPRVLRVCRDFGFHVPEKGPAEARFTLVRHALRTLPGVPADGAAHAIGLPLAEITVPGEDRITFHHASITPALVPGLPAWRGLAHLVAPRHWPDWVLVSRADTDGRLTVVEVELAEDRSLDDELLGLLDEAAASGQPSNACEVQPFDDALLYVNQHVLSSPDVFGVLGGPPMGLAPAPICPDCARVMFHLGYFETGVREYGDGFRSLFVCDDCRTTASLGTLWN